MISQIVVNGARQHNLKGVDLVIPKDSFVVFSGVSGSGKSSMAFETLYAEGQRRYVSSLSSYARQFMDQMDRPDVDSIDGLMPTISISQRSGTTNPRSTVGTITEIYDFMRVVYASIGVMHCVDCGLPIGAQSRDRITGDILERFQGSMVVMLAPIVRGQKGQAQDTLDNLRREGYVRVRVDGEIRRLDEDLNLDIRRRHDIDIVLDRISVTPDAYLRISEAVRQGVVLGNGTVLVSRDGESDRVYSSKRACTVCGRSYEELSPQSFSFNSPAGYCHECMGLGQTMQIPVEKLVPDPKLSISEGALAAGGSVATKHWRHLYEGVAKHLGFTLDTPFEHLTDVQVRGLLYGLGATKVQFEYIGGGGDSYTYRRRWEGLVNILLDKQRESDASSILWGLEKVVVMGTCAACGGRRLKPESLAVRLGGHSIADLCEMPVKNLLEFFKTHEFSEDDRRIAGDGLNEIRERLRFLDQIGLGYLCLNRTAPTLSGGEAQRIRLAGQLGRALSGVLYILDEPSIGLHQRDNARLIAALKRLRDQGNTVIVVEHDEDTIRSADYVVDFGPGPGRDGGDIVATGGAVDLCRSDRSITGHFLAGREEIPVPSSRRKLEPGLRIEGARHNNLKNITVEIPSKALVCVTGVSGSGKSSLVVDIVHRYLSKHFYDSREEPGEVQLISGVERFDKVVAIDQSPLGRIPRSNPATYTKVFDHIRKLYAELPEAKMRGYKQGHFSFNVPGGRCAACEGNGAKRLDMDFLSDVWVRCEVCEGKRFSAETLEVRFKGKNIADVLAMDVDEALDHFSSIPSIERILTTLKDVGLGYMELGQPSPTLSGGEAQRIKLSRELCKRSTGNTIYMLDEPTTGLHFWDVRKLLEVLHRLVDEGNTVVVIEHNLDVIKTADCVIDLGPEGGELGGYVVAVGTPEEVAANEKSYTGKELARVLAAGGTARGGAAFESAETVGRAGEALVPVGGTDWSSEALGVAGAARQAGVVRQTGEAGQAGVVGQAGAAGRTGDAVAVADRTLRAGDAQDSSRVIRIQGASANNLKRISAVIPKNSLTVVAGPSGAGKTTLAFDTLFAEGQRRYVESLSSYARQFLGQMQKPQVERVDGLCPAIAVDQKSIGRNARSTVGTITEIYDYLRILFARIGIPHCPRCGAEIQTLTTDQIVKLMTSSLDSQRVLILAPVQLGQGQTYDQLLTKLRRSGFARVQVDGVVHELDESFTLDAGIAHRVSVVVDRLAIDPSRRTRLTEAVDTAMQLSGGVVEAQVVGQAVGQGFDQVAGEVTGQVTGQVAGQATSQAGGQLAAQVAGEATGQAARQIDRPVAVQAANSAGTMRWSAHFSCDRCGMSLPEITPHSFSFNDPRGACNECDGLGVRKQVDINTLVPHASKSLASGAVGLWGPIDGDLARMMSLVGDRYGFDLETPVKDFSPEAWQILLYGDPEPYQTESGLSFEFRGLIPTVEYCSKYAMSGRTRDELAGLLADAPCPACSGSRLNAQARSVLLKGRSLPDILETSLSACLDYMRALDLSDRERGVVGKVVEEITSRLQFLVDVGLEYLTLGRSAAELSGGEAQRMRLASQLGSQLTGVLYVLDEPTIGLHQRDSRRILASMQRLRDLGNTLVAVEHDCEVIEGADYVLDMGPVGGDRGGYVVAAGTVPEIIAEPRSVTAPFLRRTSALPVPTDRRPQGDRWLTVKGARHNNLKSIDVAFPLGNLVCVTGVSGSGKSSLVIDIVYNYLARRLHRAQTLPGKHDEMSGVELIDKVIMVDQQPIGQSSRSSPATYTGIFDVMRFLFARLPEAKMRGYSPDKFSFNHREGWCEVCQGHGSRRIKMHFLPDVWVTCDNCEGTRYCKDALEVRYKGKSIAECLNMTVEEALSHFESVPGLKRILKVMVDFGLGYLNLGQSAPTLSAGEAQRVKLARELARPATPQTLYILDEPTVGLHMSDVALLLRFLQRLVDRGSTVICIEHNVDLLKSADYLIDLGPEGGDAGGNLVAFGTPEQVARCEESHTGRVLSECLEAGPFGKRKDIDRIAGAILRERSTS